MGIHSNFMFKNKFKFILNKNNSNIFKHFKLEKRFHSTKKFQEMPKVALFSVRPFEKQFLDESFTKVKGADKIKFIPFECRLTESTVKLVKKNFDAVAVFCNDTVNDVVLQKLHEYGIKMVSCRSAGFDHVDLKCAKELNITVTRVPKYSPNAIAEFAVGLILNLNRFRKEKIKFLKKINSDFVVEKFTKLMLDVEMIIFF